MSLIQKESSTAVDRSMGAKLSVTSRQQQQQQSQNLVHYELRIKLREGKNLAVRDITGSSDPYVKFVLNGSSVYKSKIIFKNLNPVWNEEFTVKLAPSLIKEITFSDQVAAKKNNKSSSGVGGKLADSASLISWDRTKASFSETNLNTAQLEYFLSKFKLKMFVYDYDRGFLNDDLIGYSTIDLTTLKENMYF
jgi:Ca2+-dependent lipid-binding protein